MKITELHIGHFGRFEEKELSFDDGLTIVYGENESGKSTLHAFIRSMLFGLKRLRGRASKTDMFHRYEPWDNGTYYAGTMRMTSGGKTFRLSRNFGKDSSPDELVCETDGEKLSIGQGDLAMLVGDVGEAVYDNTVSIGQMKSETDDALVQELRRYMTNYRNSGDGSLDLDGAMASLRRQKREQDALLKKRQDDMEKRRHEYRLRISYLQEDVDGQRRLIEVRKRELADIAGQTSEDTKKRETDMKETKTTHTSYAWWALLLGLICVAALIVLPGITYRVVAGVAAVVLFIGSYVLYKRGRGRDTGQTDDDGLPNKEGTNAKNSNAEAEKLQWAVESGQEELAEKLLSLENMQHEYEDFCADALTASDEETRQSAITMAAEHINALSQSIQEEAGRRLKDDTARIFSGLTGGRYTQLQIDGDFHIGVFTQDHFVPMESLSRGTIEQLYFALRMASGELLCEGETLPVILDDTFAMYDDKRLAQTLGFLAEQGRQVLLFTCHTREREIAKRLQIPHHYIEL